MPRPRITASQRAQLPDPRPARMNGGVCGFCWIGTETSHDHCRRAIRNGNGSIFVCMCEHKSHALNPNPRCTECYNTTADELDLKLYLCVDPNECDARVQARLRDNPQYQMIAEARERATLRAVAEGRRKPPREKKEPKSKVGACLCCGDATAGGKFLPGHDARLVSIWAGKVEAAEVTREDAITKFVELGTSDALIAKLTRKLDLQNA